MWQEESPCTILACQIIDFKIGVFYFQIELPRNKVGYDIQNISYKKDLLVLNEEKEIIKLYFDPTKRLNLLQESYFVYDRSSLVKQSFITEIIKFLPIYCSTSYFKDKSHWKENRGN